jgi:hypothetical protein
VRIFDKALHHREPQGFRQRLSRFFGWDRHDQPAPLPAAKVGPRMPVEHGATKAPFDRNRRRARNRAAHRSMMRNQRR